MAETTSSKLRVVIVGGVAGGASAAARARRISEDAEIVMFERGPYISFANCGLPYHVGGTIKERSQLLLMSPESFAARFAVDVRVEHDVTAIDPVAHTVTARDLRTGTTATEHYDRLILSPGARAIVPPVPGSDGPGVFLLKTIPDMDALIAHLQATKARHAVVVGGGYIGLEAAENLRERGLEVTIVELAPQVMTPVDADMASLLHQHLRLHGVDLRLGAKMTRVESGDGRMRVVAEGSDDIVTDLVVMAVGVRPETELARNAGIKLGERGGIAVDEGMRTSAPDVYAVGDAVEVEDPVTLTRALIPLAGPANRQGRIAADNALGRQARYRGTRGTAVCKVFDLAVATTGASEKLLTKLGRTFRAVTVHPYSHATYYPGACRLTLKIIFDPSDGRLLGAQAVGPDGADKRIDVLATAITAGMTVYDLEHLELCYAPPYGSAKDPVNMAGFVAANILRGDHRAIDAGDVASLDPSTTLLLDVRQPPENKAGAIPGSVLIPLPELRRRVDELPRDKKVVVYCQVGLRGYVAQRLLTQRGFDCVNVVGGYLTWLMKRGDLDALPTESCLSGKPAAEDASPQTTPGASVPAAATGPVVELDACGLQCPGPLMAMQRRMDELSPGAMLRVVATDPGFPADASAWARASGHHVEEAKAEKGRFVAVIRKGPSSPVPTAAAPAAGPKKLTMVVFSNDLDKAMASMIIANGAAAMGMETSLFFTFWGLNILRRSSPPPVDKTAIERAFGFMMPQGADKLTLSKMHMAGMGTAMMKHVMASKNVTSLPDLIAQAQAAGVRFIACTMTMDVMGIKPEELVSGVELGGVAAYLASAGDSAVNLFI